MVIVSKQYQFVFQNLKFPLFMRCLKVLFTIPTRSLEIHSKQVCLWTLAERVYIIRIIGKAHAIRFFVAKVLPLALRRKRIMTVRILISNLTICAMND